MASIELRNLHKRYGDQAVLKGIDLTIRDGEFISLVGESGCGKSTLLRTIAGLEPHSSGEILIDGAPAGHLRPRERDLAMVFQSYALYPHLSVFDNIAMPLHMQCKRLHGVPGLRALLPAARREEAAIRAQVQRVAESLHITPLLARQPGQLSGGQRQRVALGRAMVREPKAFLMDEPLSNLDATLRVHMRRELVQMHRQLGSTFIYVTHDQVEAMTMSDRVAVLMAGELVQVDTPDALYQRPNDLRVAEFIGTPRINVLPASVRQDHGLRLRHGDLQRPLETHVRLPAQAELSLAIRPEDTQLVATGQGHLSGEIHYLENLGSEVLVHLACGAAQPLVVRSAPEQGRALHRGMRCDIQLNESRLHLFDADGKRVPDQQCFTHREGMYVVG